MFNSRSIILLAFFAIAGLWMYREYDISMSANFNAAPDVIVGDLPNIQRWGADADETSFTVATTSCNIGTAQLAWIANTNQHPVISQNLYRVKDGRIEMLGMSWLKHGFTALQQNVCGSCQASGTGSALGVGCSDPYSTGNNASHSSLGPRSQINALTGYFPYPKTNLPSTGVLDGRLRVYTADINPNLNPGARYFMESMYVHPQDAAAGNGLNNASYREAFVEPEGGTGWDIEFGAPTIKRQEPAINAWKAVHPDVQLHIVDIPGDGRVIVGVRTTPLSGGKGYHTEFAIENLNSHQSVRALGITYGSDQISNPGFHDVEYQYEPYSGTDWVPTTVDNKIEWATQTYSENQNANAIRWNTLYSFWCDSETPPTQITLGLFRPGVVEAIDVLPSSVVDARVYHASFSGTGTPPWNRVDLTKVMVKEGNGPQQLTKNNLIISSQGINGLVFDVQSLPGAGSVTADDFEFQFSPQDSYDVGANPPTGWDAAPAPSSVSVTSGAPSRVLLEWPDGTIVNRWLRVTVLATENTGLEEPEVYYIGHVLGETTGSEDGTFTVSFSDIAPIRDAVGQSADASLDVDIDKNGTVSFADISAMRSNVGSQLPQITVP